MIAIVDYGAGNLTSVKLGFESIGAEAFITNDRAAILAAERVVFPGVGAIGSAMKRLEELKLGDVLKTVAANGAPFLGICLGAQIIFERSEEDGGVDGLGILPGVVKAFKPSDASVKVPQIGWNNVSICRKQALFEGIKDGSEFYFVHGYYPDPSENSHVSGRTEYAGIKFASVVGRNNVVAAQFHPERSGRIGLKLLDNFNRWNGRDLEKQS